MQSNSASSPWLVVLDEWPPLDIPKAAQVWAETLGGPAVDHAGRLRTSTGIPADRLSETDARRLAAALTACGALAWPASATMLAPLPKPVNARQLDANGDELLAQVSLTGPAERIPWNHVVLVLPATRCEISGMTGASKKAKVGLGTAALAVTTGIGAGKVLRAISGAGESQTAELNATTRTLVEIVAVKPMRRLHGYADRLDYSVLAADRVQGKRNFTTLLSRLRDKSRPALPSRPVLDRFIASGELPAMLQTDDNNALAAVSRWLLMRGVMRRLASAEQQ